MNRIIALTRNSILPAILILMATSPAAAVVEPASFAELDRLIEPSDMIVQGHVRNIDQGLRETHITFEIERVFKGDPALKTVSVTHQGGKHVVIETEPEFLSYDQAILFLKKRGDTHVCTDGILGKKTIRNDNVYTSPDNSFLTVRLNVYQDAIMAHLKAVEAQRGAARAAASKSASTTEPSTPGSSY